MLKSSPSKLVYLMHNKFLEILKFNGTNSKVILFVFIYTMFNLSFNISFILKITPK